MSIKLYFYATNVYIDNNIIAIFNNVKFCCFNESSTYNNNT